jgi:type II secretory ATPase GspE/PulE/Tfp pilus assembly ATPase PilB-like protein
MTDAFLLEAPREDAPGIIDDLLKRALLAGSSDVHLLPQEQGLLVRIRVDGVLHDLDEIQEAASLKAISRVKVLAGLDVADHQKAQDGRFSFDDVDVRVAVLPTVSGEGLVLRLLRTDSKPPSLTALGLSNAMQMDLERVIARPNGLLLVSGPTGAGKSTTLYAALVDMNRPEVSTVTVEDPVEYRLPRAFQIQVSEKRGLTFPTALRTILRSDPDIVMVGEIRDAVTAKLAIDAALSGHFVLSTLHSDDTIRTLTRLEEMGIARYLITTAVSAVLAQRLVRRLCPHCREAYEPAAAERAQLAYEGSLLYRAHGCDECTRGYRGRIGIFELLRMSEEVALAVSREEHSDAVAAAAAASGTESLWVDGLRKVEAGLTTISELRRVM